MRYNQIFHWNVKYELQAKKVLKCVDIQDEKIFKLTDETSWKLIDEIEHDTNDRYLIYSEVQENEANRND